MARSLRHSGIAWTVLLALLGACSSPPPPPPPPVLPGTRQVPLKVWVILGALGSEAIGRRENAGSRLTAAEMTLYITELQRHAEFYANNATFPWDGQFNIVNFSGLLGPPFEPNRRRTATQFEGEVITLQNKWASAHVNIYFCGAFDNDNNQNNNPFNIPDSFSADPSEFSNPYIVLDDNGSWDAAGWNALGNGVILEHEMTHFLGRFNNRSFLGYNIGGQDVTLTYDSEEHTPSKPSEWKSKNILFPGGPFFTIKIGPLEKAEMRSRIIQGTWLNP